MTSRVGSVLELFLADDARDHGAGMQPDAHAEIWAAAPPAFGDEVAHLERGQHHVVGMRRVRHGKTPDRHVGIPDGLDPFHAVPGDDDVEGVETII